LVIKQYNLKSVYANCKYMFLIY